MAKRRTMRGTPLARAVPLRAARARGGSVRVKRLRAVTEPAGVEPICAIVKPAHRRLNVFSLDPAADAKLEHALISRSVLPVRWEPLEAGPVGEYLEVVDVDPPSGCVYDPVDLNNPDLPAQHGL